MSEQSEEGGIVFLGSVVSDESDYHSAAFSRAGNSAQMGIIDGLIENGNTLVKIVSFCPLPTFPKGNRWRVSTRKVKVSGIETVLVGYINLPFIKQVSLAHNIYRVMRNLSSQKRIAVTYNYNTFFSLPMTLLKDRYKAIVPIVFDLDIPGQTIKSSLLRYMDFHLTTRLLGLVNGILAITERLAADFFNGKPTLIVEGGLSKQQVRYYSSLKVKDEKIFHIVYVGALEKYNGVDVVIDAFLKIVDRDIRLHIAGKGTLGEEISRLSKSDSRIIIYDYLEPKEVAKLYGQASVLINHRSDKRIDSRYVFPSKLIEYLATGVPVISTNFRSLPSDYLLYMEILEDETAEALVKSIHSIKRQPSQAKERAKRAREFVLKEKTWQRQMRRFTQFLEVIS